MLKLDSNEFSIEEVTGIPSQEPLQSRIIQQPATTLIKIEGMTLHKCPACGQKTLKLENGCNTCMDKECGYGKCDV